MKQRAQGRQRGQRKRAGDEQRRSVRRSINGLAVRASSVVELLKAHSAAVGRAKKAAEDLQELLVSSTREEQNRMRLLQKGDPAVLNANYGAEWDEGRTAYVRKPCCVLVLVAACVTPC